MIFWTFFILGLFFAWQGIKKGLYVWGMILFNCMVGIYVGVLSTPVILKMSPEYGDSGYYAAATMLVIAAVIFTVLQLFGYFYLLRDAEEYFPRLFDQVAGAFCGFLSSYFIVGLIVFSVSVMPFAWSIPSFLPQRESMVKFGSSAVVKACHFIGAYSLECFNGQPEAVVDRLAGTEKQKTP